MRDGKDTCAGGMRLPGIRGTADRFKRHSVAATGSRAAGDSGGSGSNRSSSWAAVAPPIRRHAPSAKREEKLQEHR